MTFKNIITLLFIVSTSLIYGQTDLVPAGGPIHIEGLIVGAENQQITLVNKNLGGLKSPIAFATADAEGKFVMDTTIAVRDYYFLRTENGQLLNLVLYPKDQVTIYGDAKDLLRMTNVIGSEHSVLLNQFLIEHQNFKMLEDSLKKVLKADQTKQAAVNAYFSPVAQQFYSYRNTFINANQGSPALIATLNALDQNREWKEYKKVVGMLNYSFAEAPTIQNLSKYIMQKEAQLKQQAAATAAKNELFKPGTLVHDIVMPNPNGEIIKLSDLKGNVVLIDFWASWCGPCRRENPHVVKAYSKYNADGFEVFSVSLDRKGAKAKWIAAIAKDGLIWPTHVSSLEGFATKAAQDYAISSIPFTVLIDQEGKVIKTNLRGPQLEAELSRIFGH